MPHDVYGCGVLARSHEKQQSGLVFNTICATLILHEAFTWWSLVGTVLVCIGAMLIAVFGAMKEPAHSLDELLQLLGHRSFIVWMVGQAIVVSAVLFLAKLIKMVNPKAKHTPRKRLMRGIAYGCVRYEPCVPTRLSQHGVK